MITRSWYNVNKVFLGTNMVKVLNCDWWYNCDRRDLHLLCKIMDTCIVATIVLVRWSITRRNTLSKKLREHLKVWSCVQVKETIHFMLDSSVNVVKVLIFFRFWVKIWCLYLVILEYITCCWSNDPQIFQQMVSQPWFGLVGKWEWILS